MQRKRMLVGIMGTLLATCVQYGVAQHMTNISTDDMSAFRPQAGNWFIAGEVSMNPFLDIHHPPAVVNADVRGKKKKALAVAEPPKAVQFKPGKGVLLNMNDDQKKDNLITQIEHGDIELELEVMLPKGSNSGIFLQGRYEVQLLDSWGVSDPAFSDIGGIYRNWEKEPAKIYMGKAPLVNAAKAPGLWQKISILFRAPRFNAQGEKVANAMFEKVELNGVLIHDHVEVPKLTGAPIAPNEAPLGPLMFQGDHGPVAFRNMRYRLLHDSEVVLKDLTYQVYHGNFNVQNDFLSASPVKTGAVPELTWEVAGVEDGFAIRYKGTIVIPEDDRYTFELITSGEGQLTVNGQTNPEGWGRKMLISELKKGTYPIGIVYYKNVSWRPPRLGLFVQGISTHVKKLHAFNSLPPDGDLVSPIFRDVGSKTQILRAFLDYDGNRQNRLTHTVAVGDPDGLHYAFDLQSGTLTCLWRGGFADATPMWHDRGDGSFRPRGMVQYLTSTPALAALENADAPFPKQHAPEAFTANGYRLSGPLDRPTFLYTYQGVKVADRMNPDEGSRMLRREITFDGDSGQQLYFRLAEGAAIEMIPDVGYAIGDKQYFIRIDSPSQPLIREQAHGVKELIVPVTAKTLAYTIIW